MNRPRPLHVPRSIYTAPALRHAASPGARLPLTSPLSSSPALTSRVNRSWPRLPPPTLRRCFSTSSILLGSMVVKVPQMAESIAEGTVAALLKGAGDRVEMDEEVVSIETDKIDVAVNAPEGGVVVEVFVGEGDVVRVGQDVVRIDTAAEAASDSDGGGKKAVQAQPQKAEEPQPQKSEQKTEPPPSHSQAPAAAPKPTPPPVPAPPHVPAAPPSNKPSRNETRVPLSRMRTRIAQRLKESQNRAASLTTFNDVDMSALLALRATHRAAVLEKRGARLGLMGAFAKAAALALRDVPAVNAAIEGDAVVWRDYVDVSVAVSTPKGLVTPVLRGCERRGLVQMEEGIAALAEKARANKITMEDLAGGNFTISNGGVFGSLFGTPIINLPQTAVLGLHGIKDRPVVVDGKVEIRPMMYLALTYDHRLVDGREAATFLVAVKKYIEDPASMLLE
ncbi:Dihydrolipoamide succinyltransferase [Neofusicoccum parvum]|uniref:Dihydrolipoamide succinyltransferase n=1 Tax=Neofusicoccum parvum TaxID=310453 RepID=A0ACB5SE31_9PEZI|nr:Dihydrolipoamide succinyltransferase [Neofusicoccum parvum]